MSHEFWDHAIIVIFFFYGLAFYSLGLSMFLESERASELKFARSMRLMAIFGLTHGSHEWFDMVERELMLHYEITPPLWFFSIRLTLLVTSFFFLLGFGILLITDRDSLQTAWRVPFLALVNFSLLNLLIVVVYRPDFLEWVRATDVLARYTLGIPGAIVTGMGLWQLKKNFRLQQLEGYTFDLNIASISLIIYGVVGQFFVGKSILFLSDIINQQQFIDFFGFPVQLLRASAAIVVAITLIRVLRVIEEQTQQQFKMLEAEKRETERRRNEELTHLNQELHEANERTARLLGDVRRRDTIRGELIHRIAYAQEAERQRIARDLHDGTGQYLTGLAMSLRGMANYRYFNPENTQEQLLQLETISTAALTELRNMINNLRPPQLDDMGLVAALRWLIERTNTQNDIDIKLILQGDIPSFSQEIEITLFRIAQEGLTNIIRHAGATEATIRVAASDGLTLSIHDNGIGFEPEKVLTQNKQKSLVQTNWGLAGIQERANLINATLEIQSMPGQGTTIALQLNLDTIKQVDSGSSLQNRVPSKSEPGVLTPGGNKSIPTGGKI